MLYILLIIAVIYITVKIVNFNDTVLKSRQLLRQIKIDILDMTEQIKLLGVKKSDNNVVKPVIN